MKRFAGLLLVVCSVGWFLARPASNACCGGGRCTGSASCSACSNCSSCAYCKGGGTCGACSSAVRQEPEEVPAPRKVPATSPSYKPSPILSAVDAVAEIKGLKIGTPAHCVVVPDARQLVVEDQEGKRWVIQLAGVRASTLDSSKPGERLAARECASDLAKRALNRNVRVVGQPQLGESSSLVYVEASGDMLNEALIADGFAFYDPASGLSESVAALFKAAEDRARAGKVGLWGPIDQIRQTLVKPEDDPAANALLKTASNLNERNPGAAAEWYVRVVDEHARSTAAVEARKQLKRPAFTFQVPPLTSHLAFEVLAKLTAGMPIVRPNLPSIAPPREKAKPPSAVASSSASEPDDTPIYSESSSRSYTPRSSPGTEVHVKGYVRKNGTYVAPYTRSRPRR